MSSLHFLLVEDDDDHAALTERSLRKCESPCDVTRVSDGEKALAYLRREGEFADASTPDVVLLDLKLPRLNGLEVLEQMRQDPELSAIPVVMLTTSDADQDRQTAYDWHVNSYLVKPINYSDFRQMLGEVSSYWGRWNCPPTRHADE
jgi:CheY-like chemotaxis protein